MSDEDEHIQRLKQHFLILREFLNQCTKNITKVSAMFY